MWFRFHRRHAVVGLSSGDGTLRLPTLTNSAVSSPENSDDTCFTTRGVASSERYILSSLTGREDGVELAGADRVIWKGICSPM